jgi:hypothetical protein
MPKTLLYLFHPFIVVPTEIDVLPSIKTKDRLFRKSSFITICYETSQIQAKRYIFVSFSPGSKNF